jgi:hypothetical protein
MIKRNLFNRVVIFVVFTLVFMGGITFFDSVQSANLTNTKVTLSTPRLSFFGNLAAGNTVGSSIVTLLATSPSINSANIFAGESVKIGYHNYTVSEADSTTTLQLTSGLLTGDNTSGSMVVASRSADLTVNFTTATAIANGYFRVLVPAATSGNADGLPDETGWDGTSDFANNVTVTCPGNVSGYTFAAGSKAANQNIGGTIYHTFTCGYSGAGGVGTEFLTTNNQMIISGLINPAPNHGVEGQGYADQYRIPVQHLDSTSAVIDQTNVAVALIEAVRVTASVAPQITFEIDGVNSSTSVCGLTTSVTTTATQVPLGELAISTFKNAAQLLSVATNADGGYVVTAIAADQLQRQTYRAASEVCTGGDAVGIAGCIPDALGEGSMTYEDADEWTLTTQKGFGYSLDAGATPPPTIAFQHDANSDTGACSTDTDCFRQFADNQATESPETLFSSTDVADDESVNVCYRAVISNTQEAGEDYSTNITYRATATF